MNRKSFLQTCLGAFSLSFTKPKAPQLDFCRCGKPIPLPPSWAKDGNEWLGSYCVVCKFGVVANFDVMLDRATLRVRNPRPSATINSYDWREGSTK